MADGARALGVPVTAEGPDLVIDGTDGAFPGGDVVIDAGLSGTTLRFLTAVAVLASGQVTITGGSGLLARPVLPLVDALVRLGCRVTTTGGRPPVVIRPGRPRGGTLSVDASKSSQFATALLLVAPFAESDVEVRVAGLGAAGYVDMTIDLMARFGAEVFRTGDSIAVRAGTGYRPRVETISGDASAAAHIFAVAAATGGEVTVGNLQGAEGQPDWAFLELLHQMGVTSTADRVSGTVTVRAPNRLTAINAGLSAMPDQLPTVAVLAALADGRSILTGLAVTRGHETDRLIAVAAELAKVGIATDTGPDWISVNGGQPRGPATIHTYDDHRMAMAFAALAARVPEISIDHPGCVAKTYPAFWSDLIAIGCDFSHQPH